MTEEKLKLLEDYINKLAKFKIKDYNGEHKNLRDFIYDFHLGPLSLRPNIFDDGSVMIRGKWRSVIDTIIACQVHHNASVQEVADVFKEALLEKTLKGHYCNNIKRIVLRLNENTWNLGHLEKSLDEKLPGVTGHDFLK